MTATAYHVRDNQLFILRKGDKEYPFTDITLEEAAVLRENLEENQWILSQLERQQITEPLRQLELFARCMLELSEASLDLYPDRYRTRFECGLAGNCPFNHTVCRRIPAPNGEAFTPIELRIMALISDGKPDADIADIMCRSVNTIKSHVQHMLQKGDFRSRVDLATHYIRFVAPKLYQ